MTRDISDRREELYKWIKETRKHEEEMRKDRNEIKGARKELKEIREMQKETDRRIGKGIDGWGSFAEELAVPS